MMDRASLTWRLYRAGVWLKPNYTHSSNAQVLTTITNHATASHLQSHPFLVSCTFYTIPMHFLFKEFLFTDDDDDYDDDYYYVWPSYSVPKGGQKLSIAKQLCYCVNSLNFSYKRIKCCLSVCLDVNQGGRNHNLCTQRLIIWCAQAY